MSFDMVGYAATDTKERPSLWSQNPRDVAVAVAAPKPAPPPLPHSFYTEGQIEALPAGQLAKAHSSGAGMQRGGFEPPGPVSLHSFLGPAGSWGHRSIDW